MSRFSIIAAAREHPDRLALLTTGTELTFADLARRVSERIDRWGARAAAVPGTTEAAPHRVALVAHPTVDAVVALLALVELGVPVVLLHPREPAAERRLRLEAAPATVVIDDEAAPAAVVVDDDAVPLAAVIDDDTAPVAVVIDDDTAPATVVIDGAAATTGSAPRGRVPAPADDARALAVLFTSGTGGGPRAVQLSRAAAAAAAAASAANLPFTDGDRWLLALSLAHVGGFAILLRCLHARRAVVLVPEAGDPDRLADAIARHRVTLASLVPTQLRRLLALDPPWRPPAHLRAVLIGGAAAPAELMAAAGARAVPVLRTYGMTETFAQVATQPPGTPAAEPGALPLPGVELRIDADGAIAVRAPQLLSGYLERGVLRPALDAQGFFVTRDAGRLDRAGCLHVLGRLDDVIVTAGEKVHPAEVEAVLAALPGVAEACAFAVHDTDRGAALAVALVAQPGAMPAADAVLAAAFARLLPWQRPRALAWIDALPLLPSGKPDRRALARAAAPRLRPLRSG